MLQPRMHMYMITTPSAACQAVPMLHHDAGGAVLHMHSKHNCAVYAYAMSNSDDIAQQS